MTRRRRSPARSASCAGSGGSTLEPGECRTVAFRLSTEQLSYVGADLRRVVEPGRVSVQVGTSSVDLPLAAKLAAARPGLELVERTVYLTPSTIE